jgi:hypothetical protein
MTNQATPLILDHDKGTTTGTKSPLINDAALHQGLLGIHHLAIEVRHQEVTIARSQPEAERLAYYWPDDLAPWIPAAFNWFSVSVINHLRLVALVDLLNANGWRSSDLADPTKASQVKPHCTAFVKAAAPKLYTWRNKVGAHFAATDPHSDAGQILEQSIWTPVTYSYPYFVVGTVLPGNAVIAEGLPIWSLTQTFEQLRSRFWPFLSLPPRPPVTSAMTKSIRRGFAPKPPPGPMQL